MNAIILAAGTSSRFVPLSYECPKGLLTVKGEVLIERQIRQLKDAGILDITVVVGYKAEMFSYLQEDFGVQLVYNEDFARYNNTSSLIRVLDKLGDTYLCSSDNYFPENVFVGNPQESYYSALFAEGPTREYCLRTDANGNIRSVTMGGADSWYMVGHVFLSQDFADAFKPILQQAYQYEGARQQYWEDIYISHIDELPLMRMLPYAPHDIEEFDSLEELRAFDSSYLKDTRSTILKKICEELDATEEDLVGFQVVDKDLEKGSFRFFCMKDEQVYLYYIENGSLHKENPFSRECLLRHLQEIFPKEDVSAAEIEQIGGMSNKNFKVNLHDKVYVLRVPGYGSQGMVDRSVEEFNARAACEMKVTPVMRYFNSKTGVKLVDYIMGSEALNATTIQQREHMEQIVRLYHTIHHSALRLKNTFNIFREIEKYDALLAHAGASMYAGWELVRPRVMALEGYLESLGVELKACHNDAVPENFIKAQDGTIYLIDWEYSGMNEPMADFAALFLESDFEKENEDFMLQLYFQGDVPVHAREKIKCYQVLWDYLWAQWTVIKEAEGDDFGTYGMDRYQRAIRLLNTIEME